MSVSTTPGQTTPLRGSALALESAQLERSARRFWVSLVVLMLGIQVAIGATALYLANSDPTVAIIPNYYESAVNWDSTRRARELASNLGWSIRASVGPQLEGERLFRVELKSRDGMPVSNARVSAELYHHAKGADIHRIRLQESEAGIYIGNCTIAQAGLWQMDLHIEGEHGIAAENRVLYVTR